MGYRLKFFCKSARYVILAFVGSQPRVPITAAVDMQPSHAAERTNNLNGEMSSGRWQAKHKPMPHTNYSGNYQWSSASFYLPGDDRFS